MLILAATPIGNLGDASRRLIEALQNAETIAAEDTRTAIQLMRALGVDNRPRLVALHEHNERERAASLAEEARDADILVLTDAGMPTVSDPGFVLVQTAVAVGVTVTAIPGPSAVLTALALTKLHEEVARGTLAELAERFADGARGEIVLVVAGAEPVEASLEDGVGRVLTLVAEGSRLKEASAEVAEQTGLSRKELYDAALRAR